MINLIPKKFGMICKNIHHAPPASLRFVVIGGATLEPALAQRALEHGWPLYLCYGMTETGSQIAGCKIDQAALTSPLAVEAYAGVEIKIDNTPSSTDGSGQIALRGAQIMSGYASTQNQSQPNTSEQRPDKNGWLLTNDIGKLDNEGKLIILGRADDVIISGGENIHPAQVEAILQDCPGIDEIAIAAKHDSEWGQCLIAIYTGEVGKEQIEQWSREKLNGNWRPRQFVKSKALPHLANGKLDRQSLATALSL